jgi:hypothetical protein
MPAGTVAVNIDFVNQITHAGLTWHVLGEYTDNAPHDVSNQHVDNPSWSGNRGILLWTRSNIGSRQWHNFTDSGSRYDTSDIRAFIRNGWNVPSQTFYVSPNSLWRQQTTRLNGVATAPPTHAGGIGWQWGSVVDNYFLISIRELFNPVYFPTATDRMVGGSVYWSRTAINISRVILVPGNGVIPMDWMDGTIANVAAPIIPAMVLY